MSRVSDDLYTWRAVYRLTQEDAAQLLGVSIRTIGRWERDEQRPTEDHYNTVRWVIAQPPPGWVRDAGEAGR
jgi:transcriptional regulator with XRE-family HTH domain